jgi:16S rRNA (uracil1498-N3)-methyltransferase
VIRRVYTPKLRIGVIELDEWGSRHARDVLRLTENTEVEMFDDRGAVGDGVIISLRPNVIIHCDAIRHQESVMQLTIASAVPKGDRAAWMIEKLSELGCARFVPLATSRSIVLPWGTNKRDRWLRLAIESAKQSRRPGVMQLEELTDVSTVATPNAFFLDFDGDAITSVDWFGEATLLIGPEGGWSPEEKKLFSDRAMKGLKLTETILRVETAAVTAAAVVMALASNRPRQS